jgi:DNA-binding transcriptional MerR regulator
MAEVLTSGEAAKQLGISVSLIRKLEYIGVTPPARRLSRFRVYTPEELEALRRVIEERRGVISRQTMKAA